MNERQLVLIVGPTAVGKTGIAVQLAKHFSCDIVSCDSRQFYRELAIGTAKPTAEEMQGVKHYFVNSHSISDSYSAGDYERDALKLLDKLFKANKKVIMTGGSGLFVKAITHGLDELPTVDLAIRDEIMKRLADEGIEKLAIELQEKDTEYADKVDLQNTQRVVRALEVVAQTGRPFSSFHNKKKATRKFDIVKVGLERPRAELYARINQRVDDMVAEGLVEEVKTVISFREHNALKTVGYKEVVEYLDGNASYNEMLELIKRNTRRYAKRQLTWFKNQDDFTWFNPEKFEDLMNFIDSR